MAVPAHAQIQTTDAMVYTVSDVDVDVTADSAAHARDQAVGQAQRTALDQLLDRLGVDASVATKLSNDDIATLVKNFEVQSEHASSVRYLGTFTVQFKPNAVRSFLAGRHANYIEQRSSPIVILPVYENSGHPILWEETTRWRAAWDNVPHNGGLVPVIVPSGGLDDIGVLSTEEAVDGKSDAMLAFIEKYQAGGAAVVTLKGNLDVPTGPFSVEVQRFDSNGDALDLVPLALTAPADKTGIDSMLAQAVKLARHQLEADWRQDLKGASQPVQTNAQPQDMPVSVESQMAEMGQAAPIFATVPIATLAQWAQIQRKIASTPHVQHVGVVTIQRGAVSIELDYQGNIQDVQTALMMRNLQLKQDAVSGAWVLNPF